MGALSIMPYRKLLEDTFGSIHTFQSLRTWRNPSGKSEIQHVRPSIPNQLGDGYLKREEDPRGGNETALEGGPDRKGVTPLNQEV